MLVITTPSTLVIKSGVEHIDDVFLIGAGHHVEARVIRTTTTDPTAEAMKHREAAERICSFTCQLEIEIGSTVVPVRLVHENCLGILAD